ncbi:MAG: hypothetical protein ACRD2Y_00390, partial [Terriglobales bacterium]
MGPVRFLSRRFSRTFLAVVLCLGWVGHVGAGPPAACSCGCGGTPRPACAHSCGGTPCTDGVASSKPSAAAGCTCGCGGTPRPACAHSCGGTPCTGSSLKNSRIIMGQVVENQPATFSVVGQNGNALTGFVVEFDRKQKSTTDRKGEAGFVPEKRGKVMAEVPGVARTAIQVISQEEARSAPQRVPRFAQAGDHFSVTQGGLFDGHASNTQASLDQQACAVMFEAPHQAIVYLPEAISTGAHTLSIEDQGRKLEKPLSVIRLQLSADKLNLAKHEVTRGRVVIEGADNSLVGGQLHIENLSTEIVELTLTGSSGKRSHVLSIQPGMIRDGKIEVPFTIRAKRGGAFSLLARVADPNMKGA